MLTNNDKNQKINGKILFFDGHEQSIPYDTMEITKNELNKATQDISEIILPPATMRIGARAFSWYKNMKKITIPKNVYSIGEGAFMGTNSCTAPGMTVGDGATVACGTPVLKDVAPGCTLSPFGALKSMQ